MCKKDLLGSEAVVLALLTKNSYPSDYWVICYRIIWHLEHHVYYEYAMQSARQYNCRRQVSCHKVNRPALSSIKCFSTLKNEAASCSAESVCWDTDSQCSHP